MATARRRRTCACSCTGSGASLETGREGSCAACRVSATRCRLADAVSGLVHELFTASQLPFASGSRCAGQGVAMADLLAVLGTVAFVIVMLGLIRALERV